MGKARNYRIVYLNMLVFLAISVVILPHIIGWLLVSFLLFLSFPYYVVVGLFRALFILLDS